MSFLKTLVDELDTTTVIIFLLVFLIGYYWLTTPPNLPPGPPGLPVASECVNHFTIFLLVFLIGYYWLTTPPNLPPGPPGLPVVGNLLSMAAARKDVLGQLKQWRKKYGDLFTVRLGNKYLVVINSYKLMHEAYVRQADAFSGRPNHFHSLKRIIAATGEGVAFSEGRTWKELRRVTLMTLRDFGVGKKSLEQRVHEEARAVMEVMDKGQGQPIKVAPLLSKFAANVICSVVLGNRFDYDHPQFVQLTEKVRLAFSQPFIFSPDNFIPITRVVPAVQKAIDNQVNSFVEIDKFLGEILKDHEMTYDPGEVRDFVDLYIKTREETKDTHMYTASNLRRVIVDLLAGGTETTATTIDWILLHLIAHPHAQRRCQQEIDKVIGQGRMVTMDDRKDLPYIMAVIAEIMRLVTIAPLAPPRMTGRDTDLGGFTIPKGTIVVPNIREIHHEASFWTDPQAFKPERFLDDRGQFSLPKENYVPFSIGPRMCLGEVLARMEVFLLFATLIQSFTFSMGQGQKPDLQGQLGVTFSPKSQPVYVTRR